MTDPTPYDYWRYAKEFFDAGRVLQQSVASQVSMPAFFLFGQSIELSLKAFLLGRGIPSEDLRKKYGHDLDALLCRSRRRKLGREVKLKADDLSAIDVLNWEYYRHRYRYHQSDLGPEMIVPPLAEIARTAKKLVNGLRGYCTGYRGFDS